MLREALTIERLRAMEVDEAAALFVARRAEGWTGQEEALFADWLATDENAAAAVGRADRAWTVLAEDADNEILAAMRAHALVPAARSAPRRWYLAAAAVAAMLVAVFTATLFPGGDAPPSDPAAKAIRYASARGEVKTVALPDGSVMTLDADSVAVGRFGKASRSVELIGGRAYFDVKKGLEKPFSVDAGARHIVALGTRFEVDALDRQLKVTLLEGRVAVEARNGGTSRHVLAPGQQFVETAGGGTVRPFALEDAAPGWSRGLIELDNRTLGEAIAQMNRYSRDQVAVRDPRVASLRVSGQFQTGDAPRFARSIAEIYPVRVIRGDRGLELVSEK